MPKPTMSTSFWNRVDKTDTCWLWTGHVDPQGYGRHNTFYAHRFSFELHAGEPIPQGLQIDHICHRRACVNPAHLRSVTNKENGENRKGPNQNSTSGVRGVTWNKRHQKWCAKFRHNRQYIYVGMYDRLEDAECAIIAKRNKVFTCNSKDRRSATVAEPSATAEHTPATGPATVALP